MGYIFPGRISTKVFKNFIATKPKNLIHLAVIFSLQPASAHSIGSFNRVPHFYFAMNNIFMRFLHRLQLNKTLSINLTCHYITFLAKVLELSSRYSENLALSTYFCLCHSYQSHPIYIIINPPIPISSSFKQKPY